jgi:hypothetical protein
MRRMIITAVAIVSLAAPSAALARAGERHHHHRGRHHHHAHVLAFHAQAPASSTSGTGTSGSTPAASDSAGKVASFANGVLTITLNDGSTVSGKVTDRTEIECAAPSASAADFSGDGGDENGEDRGGQESGGPGPSGGERGGPGGDDEAGDDDARAEAEHCTTAALQSGASVTEAFLSVGSGGATWLKVEL